MNRLDYIGLISHEVKTPIASISGYSDIIRNGMADEETTYKYANNIYRESNRMAKLVDDMVYILKSYENDLIPELSDKVFSRIFINAIDRIKEQYGYLGDIEVNYSEASEIEENELKVDEFMFEEAIYKILENCVIHGNNQYKNDSRLPYVNINIVITKFNDKIKIEISDSGKGMSEDVAKRSFELFYREDKIKSRFMGCNGVGLSVVDKIIAVHGGKCNISSKVNEGTMVTIII